MLAFWAVARRKTHTKALWHSVNYHITKRRKTRPKNKKQNIKQKHHNPLKFINHNLLKKQILNLNFKISHLFNSNFKFKF